MILGIHSLGHDTGLVLIKEGKVVFQIETERLTRIKHDSNIGVAIAYLLSQSLFSVHDISLIAFSTNVSSKISGIENLEEIQKQIGSGVLHYETTSLLLGEPKPCLVVAHEASHAATAAHFAGWPANLLILVNEGRGTFSRNSLFVYESNKLELIDYDALPWYATGWGWSALSHMLQLGAGPSDAGKAMALGAYGNPSELFQEAILEIPSTIHLSSREKQEKALLSFEKKVGFQNVFSQAANIVYEFQNHFTLKVFTYLREWLGKRRSSNLALSGGCALNLPANTFIRKHFDGNLFIPPCPNDSGQALGAALYASVIVHQKPVQYCDAWINGFPFDEDVAKRALKNNNIKPIRSDERKIAELLGVGKVIAYMDGPASIGPRSLGDRSILANPTIKNIRKKVSEEIKKREWFRPLSPIMNIESFQRLFPGEAPSPCMLFQYHVDNSLFPEALHIDRSARIQTLGVGTQERLRNILTSFEELTGVPALINTSLNSRGKAICYKPEHAFDDFKDNEIDYFVFGSWMGKNK